MESNKEAVCAVVVTYNRKDLLLDCLSSLLRQSRIIDAIIIIDNCSNDGTPNSLLDSGYIKKIPTKAECDSKKCFEYNLLNTKIFYICLPQNTGGAGGFYEGVKTAFSLGYGWLWLMDDDVEPHFDCLESLLNHSLESEILMPVRIYKDGQLAEFSATRYNFKNPFLLDMKRSSVLSDYESVDRVPPFVNLEDFPFEGPLISRRVIEKTGFPNPAFFIYGDDTDYAFRCKRSGSNILLVKSALLVRKIKPNNENNISWKNYYVWRNTFVLHYIYANSYAVKFKPFFMFLSILIKWCILKKFKTSNAILIFFAFFDSVLMKLKPRYLPGKNL